MISFISNLDSKEERAEKVSDILITFFVSYFLAGILSGSRVRFKATFFFLFRV